MWHKPRHIYSSVGAGSLCWYHGGHHWAPYNWAPWHFSQSRDHWSSAIVAHMVIGTYHCIVYKRIVSYCIVLYHCSYGDWRSLLPVALIKSHLRIQDPLPTLLFLRLPLCCFCDPLCCFCGPLCWNVFPFCWFVDPFCCFWSAKWECVFPKCHPPSRMLILYLSRINNSGPSKAKNQQFLSNKTESTNCADQSLVGSFQACRW